MIPNFILKLKIKKILLKKNCQTCWVLFYWQSVAKKKERKKENEATLDGFNSQKWENQIL